jgi:hypothetical protein
MSTSTPVARLPWRRILVTVAAILAVAWAVGFGAGLIVRLVFAF